MMLPAIVVIVIAVRAVMMMMVMMPPTAMVMVIIAVICAGSSRTSAMGHSRPGGAGDKPGHVRYSAESGSKCRALAARLRGFAY